MDDDLDDIQSFDVEAYLAEAQAQAQAQEKTPGKMGPVNNVAPVTEEYDSETLNYLLSSITDSFHSYIVKSIEEAKLSEDGKRRLRMLASEFTDKEIVVALIKDYSDVRSHLNNFREVAKYSKLCMRRIDANTEFFILLSAIETHYKLKLTRAWKGFERREMQTTRMKSDVSSSYSDKTERRPEATGIRKVAMNLYGGK